MNATDVTSADTFPATVPPEEKVMEEEEEEDVEDHVGGVCGVERF